MEGSNGLACILVERFWIARRAERLDRLLHSSPAHFGRQAIPAIAQSLVKRAVRVRHRLAAVAHRWPAYGLDE
jgi:hypothetical protein